MTMADDAAGILSVWGATFTVFRRSVSYGDTGKPSVSWTNKGSATAMKQPGSDNTSRGEPGIKVVATWTFFFPNGTDILEGDRLQPVGWAAGDDEYEVDTLEAQPPSHVKVVTVLAKGHGG